MLSAAELRGTQRRRRSPYSDKQHYQEYILQRIEGYKNSIGRDELMRLGDEAASELQTTSEDQFVLTEVLMLETVDRLIMKRLALRPYNRWRRQFIKLREAQRTPTHWGLEPACALSRLLPRLEPQDAALVIGSGAELASYLLAAHDAVVTFIACDLGCVERVESRMAAEALASLFEGYVAQLGATLPPFLDEIGEPRHRRHRSRRSCRIFCPGPSRAARGPSAPEPARRGPRGAWHVQGDRSRDPPLAVRRLG